MSCSTLRPMLECNQHLINSHKNLSDCLRLQPDTNGCIHQTLSKTETNQHNQACFMYLLTSSISADVVQSNHPFTLTPVNQPNNPISAKKQPDLKYVGRKIFNAKFHFFLKLSRMLAISPALLGIWSCSLDACKTRASMPSPFDLSNVNAFASLTFSHLLLAAVWCVVAGYLSYSVLDGLADRWIVTYSSPAVIIRLLSASALNAAMTQALLAVVSHDPAYRLHAWILIACILTIAYAVQNFMASNFALEKRPRSVDLYKIAVFAVVPVGLVSFFTMLGMMRGIMILQFQYDVSV